MACIATGNRDDALDIVQDAMLKLAQKYAGRPADEWGPLFHCILQSRIRDWYRRAGTRGLWMRWFGRHDHEAGDSLDQLPDPGQREPLQEVLARSALERLEEALLRLPPRQQQAFLLRVWEGLDVAQTAGAMRCSEGSVKTHFSRAVHSLRASLEDHWP